MNRRFPTALLGFLAAASFAACSTDDGVGPIPPGAADITLDITASRTLHAETTYTLKGFIHVGNGATLTIEAGTKIIGDFATQGSSLFILRGAKIIANGTAAKPIVFTSSKAAGSRAPGDWGGLILIGNGIINRVVTGGIEVEGTNTVTGTTSGTNYRVTYDAGNNNADNSGELSYVRVEFAGFAPVLDNELNSFTFCAVGSGTKLSYLESMNGLDDAFEFFGGAVDADHLVAYETSDDGFDMSEGYIGRLQYLISFQSARLTPTQGGSLSNDPQGIENDGCDASKAGCTTGFNSTPHTIPLIANFTMVGAPTLALSGGAGGIGMLLRRGTGGYYVNGVMGRWPRAAISVRDAETFSRAQSSTTPDISQTATELAIRNVVLLETSGNAPAFETGTGRFSFDLAGNSITTPSALTSAVFTIPATTDVSTTEAAFDWTPAAGSAPTSGSMATFTGVIATKATGASSTGNVFAGTAYMGAVGAGGTKWWASWTKYSQK